MAALPEQKELDRATRKQPLCARYETLLSCYVPYYGTLGVQLSRTSDSGLTVLAVFPLMARVFLPCRDRLSSEVDF